MCSEVDSNFRSITLLKKLLMTFWQSRIRDCILLLCTFVGDIYEHSVLVPTLEEIVFLPGLLSWPGADLQIYGQERHHTT